MKIETSIAGRVHVLKVNDEELVLLAQGMNDLSDKSPGNGSFELWDKIDDQMIEHDLGPHAN